MNQMFAWMVSASVLILLLLLLRRVLTGRVDPRIVYALWALALLRLLLPFSLFQSRASVLNPVEAPARAVTAMLEENRINTYAVDVDRTDHTLDEYREMYADKGELSKIRGYPSNGPYADTWTLIYARPLSELLPRLLRWVWIGGMICMGGALLWSNLSFYLRLRRNRKPFDCDSALPVYLTAAVETPCLFGLFRPGIYLPPEAADLGKEQLRHILLHEETHRRHLDHLWALGRCAALVLHWYNPLVRLAARVSLRDCELACDAGAMGRLDGSFADYGRTLIALSCAPRDKALLRTATMMTGDKSTLQERIRLIAKRPKLTAFGAALVCVLAIGAAVLTFTGSARAELTPELREAAEQAQSSGTLPAIHYTTDSEYNEDNIALGAVYGADLADLMESGVFRTALKQIGAPASEPPSPNSVELILDENTRLTIYKRPSRAKLTRDGETLWFRVGGGSYTRAAALLEKPRQDYLALWPDYRASAARLEKRDGETILVTSEIDSLISLRSMLLSPDASAPDPAEDWIYRLVFDPSEIVKNRE